MSQCEWGCENEAVMRFETNGRCGFDVFYACAVHANEHITDESLKNDEWVWGEIILLNPDGEDEKIGPRRAKEIIDNLVPG